MNITIQTTTERVTSTTVEDVDLRTFKMTEIGNAERFAKLYAGKVRYVHERKSWLIWDGRRWAFDKRSKVMQMAKLLVRAMYVQAGVMGDPNFSSALSEWAMKCESKARLESLLALAQSEPGIAVGQDALDGDPWLLNLRNGTYDLRDGTLRPHSPHDLITRLVDLEWDYTADATIWERFLDRIFGGDKELTAYIQRAVGYSLTGLTTDHVLFYLLGSGRNGKSTFIETLVDLMAEYSVRLRTESLITKDGSGGIPNDIAALAGMRICVTDETEADQRMAEKTIKALTGGDEIRARFLHQEFFTFKPAHKLWMFGNHKLTVRGTDVGIWKRIKLIPFSVTIPDSERDPFLKEKLRAEMPGILAWALNGAVAWRANGLGSCAAIERATETYRKEMDVIEDWLETDFEQSLNDRVLVSDLYTSYKSYMDENGERAISKRRLCVILRERGMESTRGTAGNIYFTGLKSLSNKVNLSNF